MSTLHKSHLFIHPCGKRPHGFWSGLEHVRETDLEQTDYWFQLIGSLYSSIQVDSSRAFSGLLRPWYSELINIVIAYDLHFLIFWCHSKQWNNLYWVVKYFTFHKSQKTDRSSSSGFWHTHMFFTNQAKATFKYTPWSTCRPCIHTTHVKQARILKGVASKTPCRLQGTNIWFLIFRLHKKRMNKLIQVLNFSNILSKAAQYTLYSWALLPGKGHTWTQYTPWSTYIHSFIHTTHIEARILINNVAIANHSKLQTPRIEVWSLTSQKKTD